jgi:hypothetical protein
MKLVKLIKMRLNEMDCKARRGKHFSDNFPIKKSLKRGDNLSPLLLNFDLEYAILKIPENQVELKSNGTHQLLVCAGDVNLLGDNTETITKNTENLFDASKGVCLEVNAVKLSISCCLVTRIKGKIMT